MSADDRGMSDTQIERVFGALGRIEQKIDGTNGWMKEHAEATANSFKEVSEKVAKLEIGHARQKGVLAALAGVGSVLGAGIGYAVDLLRH
jgi:hypothetical protein